MKMTNTEKHIGTNGQYRICHLTSVHPYYDMRILSKECHSLASAGYETHLVAPQSPNGEHGKITFHSIHKHSRRLMRMLMTTLSVYLAARKVNADLYHFHDIELIPVGLLLRFSGKHVIYDVHEDMPQSVMKRQYIPWFAKRLISTAVASLEHVSARLFSALVVATPTIATRFLQSSRQTVVINNYPLMDELLPTNRKTWADRSNSVAYVGTIALERGIVEMVQAIEYLSSKNQVRLELAGSFSPLDDREKVIKLAGWQHVKEWGHANRSEVRHILEQVQAGLVLLHPDPRFVVSQPTKLFEYMAAGIPVIASDFPLWREMIESIECGLVVDPLNPHAIGNAIEYILSHPLEAELMGKKGQDAVLRNYNWHAEECKLLHLYTSLLSHSHKIS